MTLLTLLAAIALLCLWVVFTFVIPAGLGIVHVLLGLGAALLVRWWVIRDTPAAPSGSS
jgi:hypothetical protein